MTRLNVVSEELTQAPQSETAASQTKIDQASLKLLVVALQALSQRAVVALSSLFTLIVVGSAWYLWHETLPNPTVPQLVGLGLYGILAVALHVVRRS